MRKFFKMGLVILMVLMLVCSLVGCNNSGANSDDKQSADVSSGLAEDVSNSNADSDNIGSEDDIGDDMRLRKHKVGNGYSYMLGETEVVVEVDIDDYLSEKDGKRSFDFDALAEHYGFTPKWLGYPAAILEQENNTVIVSVLQDSSEFTIGKKSDCFLSCLQMRFLDSSENRLLRIETAHTESAIHDVDLLYRVEQSGKAYVGSHLAVVCAYALEGLRDNPIGFTLDEQFHDHATSSGNFDFS
ncbi:MAG: hypothetical protein IJ872_02650 [Eubacterium sp.]|nr:hypothetical protein [Eubacterium sp.]